MPSNTVDELRTKTGEALRTLRAENVKLCDLVTALARVVGDLDDKVCQLEGRLQDVE